MQDNPRSVARFLNGPLVPGDVIGPRYREQIQRIKDAREELTAGEYAGAVELAGEILSWGRFWEEANLHRVAELLRCSTKWASKLLVKLSRLHLIGWLSKRGNGARCFLGLAPELMPLQEERSNPAEPVVVPVSEDSNSLTVEETVHNVVQLKAERDARPTPPVIPDRSELLTGNEQFTDTSVTGTPEEEHRWDAEYAADWLCFKVFHGKRAPAFVTAKIADRLQSLPPGMIPELTPQLLNGPVAPDILNPTGYALRCVNAALERLSYRAA